MDGSSELANWDGSLTANIQRTVFVLEAPPPLLVPPPPPPPQQLAEEQEIEELFNFADLREQEQERNAETTTFYGHGAPDYDGSPSLNGCPPQNDFTLTPFDLLNVDGPSSMRASPLGSYPPQVSTISPSLSLSEPSHDTYPSHILDDTFFNKASTSKFKLDSPNKELPSYDQQYLQIYTQFSSSYDQDTSALTNRSRNRITAVDSAPSISDLPELTTDTSPADTSGAASPLAGRDLPRGIRRRENRAYVELVHKPRPASGAHMQRTAEAPRKPSPKKVKSGQVHDSLADAYNHAAFHDTINPRTEEDKPGTPSTEDEVIVIVSSDSEERPSKRRKPNVADRKRPRATKTIKKGPLRPSLSPSVSPRRPRTTKPRRPSMRRPVASPPPSTSRPRPRSPSLVPESDLESERKRSPTPPPPLRRIPRAADDVPRSLSPAPSEVWKVSEHLFAYANEDDLDLQHFPRFRDITARVAREPLCELEPWDPSKMTTWREHPDWRKVDGNWIRPSNVTRSWGDIEDDWPEPVEEQPGEVEVEVIEVLSDTEELETVRDFPPSTAPDMHQTGSDAASIYPPLQSSPIPTQLEMAGAYAGSIMSGVSHAADPPLSDITSLSYIPPNPPFDPSSSTILVETVSPMKTIAPHLLGGPSQIRSPSSATSETEAEDQSPTQKRFKVVIPPPHARIGPINGKRRPLRGAGVDARKVYRARAEDAAATIVQSNAPSSSTSAWAGKPSSSKDVKGKGRVIEPSAISSDDESNELIIVDSELVDDDTDYRPSSQAKGKIVVKKQAPKPKVGPPKSATKIKKARKDGLSSAGPSRVARGRGPLLPPGERSKYCHHCRRATSYEKMLCSSCNRVYCSRCISHKYPEIVFDASAVEFSCPACHDECTCDKCTRGRGEEYISQRGTRTKKRLLPAAQLTPTPDPPTPFSGDAPGTTFGTVYSVSGERLGTSTVGPDRSVIVVHRDAGVRVRGVHVFAGVPQRGWKPREASPSVVEDRCYVGKKRPRDVGPPISVLDPEQPLAVRSASLSPLTDLDASISDAKKDELASDSGSALTPPPADDGPPMGSSPTVDNPEWSPTAVTRVIKDAMAAVNPTPSTSGSSSAA